MPAQHDNPFSRRTGGHGELIRLRRSLIRLQDETRLLRRDLLRRKYNPSQPRVPAGSSGGGQWTSGSGGGDGHRPSRASAERMVWGSLPPTAASSSTKPAMKPGPSTRKAATRMARSRNAPSSIATAARSIPNMPRPARPASTSVTPSRRPRATRSPSRQPIAPRRSAPADPMAR